MKTSTTAKRLQSLINSRNINQTEILEACNRVCRKQGIKEMGKSAISQYVSGKVQPKQDKLFILAEALDVSPTWLMGFDEPDQADTSPAEPMTEWNVVYPAGVALRTTRQPEPPAAPRPGEVAAGLSELDILRIAQQVKNLNEHSTPSRNLNSTESQLVDDFRRLRPSQRRKVEALINKLLEDRYGEDY